MLAAGCIVLWHLNVKRGAPCCPGKLLLLSNAMLLLHMLLKQRCCTAVPALT
jgi:hypothetical protein